MKIRIEEAASFDIIQEREFKDWNEALEYVWSLPEARSRFGLCDLIVSKQDMRIIIYNGYIE